MPMDSLVSIPTERICLGALFKFKDKIWIEVSGKVSEECFVDADGIHKIIFSVIKKHLDKGEDFNDVLIAQEISNFKINFKNEINIFEYCNILKSTQVTEKSALQNFTELVKLRICRDLYNQSRKTAKWVAENRDKSIEEIVSGYEKISNDQININFDEDPKDLYIDLIEKIEYKIKNPVEIVGLKTPFKCWNDYNGGLRSDNGLYCIVSRAGRGKSTFLLSMAQGVSLLNNIPVIYLDTEMTSEVSQFRLAAADFNVPYTLLESGEFYKYPKYKENYETRKKEIKDKIGRLFHKKVVNKGVDEVISYVKRWYHKFVGSGNRCLIVYDYIKITSSYKLSDYNKEYQIVGEICSKLNELSHDLNSPVISAAQGNRDLERGMDDSASIGISDRISWLAAYVGIFRDKSLDEISDHGTEHGTHILKKLKGRFQGKEATGFRDYVNTSLNPKKPKYEHNYFNYIVDNFSVSECGTLQDIMKYKREQFELQEDSDKEDNVL